MSRWLLDRSVLDDFRLAISGGFIPSASDVAGFEAARASSRISTFKGSTAKIEISGVITKSPSLLASIFGGGNTTYPEIISALDAADKDPSIKDITLSIDSPGGQFDGLFDAIGALQSTKKPITAEVSNVAASAAFAIATQADTIKASNIATRFGSVGVVATVGVADDEISITSSKAPKKRPDVSTEEGVKAVVEELDAMHEIFVEAIADGRNTSPDHVNAEFGQGATLLAKESLKRGMIDQIGFTDESTENIAATSGNTIEANQMDLKTLQAQHPDVYAAALETGVNQERDRVVAHLTLAEPSCDYSLAAKAIKEGEVMTETLRAQYMVAGMNRKDTERRFQDNVAAGAVDGINTSSSLDDGDDVLALVETKLGIIA
jgi:ClpP class serine protease